MLGKQVGSIIGIANKLINQKQYDKFDLTWPFNMVDLSKPWAF